MFRFADTKDKRAVSTQWGGAPLALVMFPGNCFKQFASKLTALNDSLIGIKRLANGSLRTYVIGAVVLREEWKSTLSVILDPREGDIFLMFSCVVTWTLRQLPRHLVAERAILQGLKKCPRNYLQALKAIPRTLRMMTLYYDEPAQVSLDGRLVNANEASSARAIKGGLNPEQAMAWELFSPIQRFLFVVVIVVVISVAIAESKKNRHIMKLKKSVELSVCGN
ncbi:hypothetical protein L3X38_026548 [Prunus dulcis]|uniref:Uncharacterized protein n=1 Tax=Prunus dulcis TaxID=3755 RepID=A0AAD4VNR8_PRUDU|nr:hypothetical protein L3X38_026548 [Prunus dulcis]